MHTTRVRSVRLKEAAISVVLFIIAVNMVQYAPQLQNPILMGIVYITAGVLFLASGIAKRQGLVLELDEPSTLSALLFLVATALVTQANSYIESGELMLAATLYVAAGILYWGSLVARQYGLKK